MLFVLIINYPWDRNEMHTNIYYNIYGRWKKIAAGYDCYYCQTLQLISTSFQMKVVLWIN